MLSVCQSTLRATSLLRRKLWSLCQSTQNDLTCKEELMGSVCQTDFTSGKEAVVAVCESSQWVISFLGKKPWVLCVKAHRQ